MSLLTEPGAIVGTVPYMSPEQVKGETVDARSDIFSFGVAMYEMVSGRRPFAGESAAATASAILTKEPLPLARYAPDAPAELQRIVRKCLDKGREQRYQSARDLLIDLRNLVEQNREAATVLIAETGTQQPIKMRSIAFAAVAVAVLALALLAIDLLTAGSKAIDSIAVLPLVNASADPNTEYLSDGITESLINNLSAKRQSGPVNLALVYVGLGQKDQAFAWLEKDFQSHSGELYEITYDPAFDTLRSDPRYTDLLRRMGLRQ